SLAATYSAASLSSPLPSRFVVSILIRSRQISMASFSACSNIILHSADRTHGSLEAPQDLAALPAKMRDPRVYPRLQAYPTYFSLVVPTSKRTLSTWISDVYTNSLNGESDEVFGFSLSVRS